LALSIWSIDAVNASPLADAAVRAVAELQSWLPQLYSTTMDLRLLEIFCRVYKERSFSRAAKKIGLTQPTVSVHIRELEKTLGTAVFNRHGREIEPTEAGRFLYEQAEPLVSLKRDLTEKMAAFLDRIEGLLAIGASSVPGEHLLPELVMHFHAEHPGAKLRLHISDTAETIDGLRHGDVEIGVVGGKLPDEDLLFESFSTDSLVLLVPTTGPWQGRREVSLRQLQELPLIVREPGSATRTSLERALASRKVNLADLNIVAELGSMGSIREAVRTGGGASFVSETSVVADVQTEAFVLARVPELGPIVRTYYTVTSRKRVLTPVASAFLGYLRQRARRPAGQSRGKSIRHKAAAR
jgi:DNA-binding transcriptional LysR family regulator